MEGKPTVAEEEEVEGLWWVERSLEISSIMVKAMVEVDLLLREMVILAVYWLKYKKQNPNL